MISTDTHIAGFNIGRSGALMGRGPVSGCMTDKKDRPHERKVTRRHGDSNLSAKGNLSMKLVKTMLLSLCLGTSALAAAADLPPLREVKEIDRNMLWAGLAVEVADECPTIDVKKLKGLSFLWGLKNKASEMGYSDDEIRAYVESDREEARIRRLGEDYVRQAGFDPTTAEGLCAFGEAEIKRGSVIGSFLRSTK
ncbi:hypothetical protein LX82_00282 [Celeribacter halophilus]|uniref:DUF5333 domain-containing protein n=2 Tax=Celeribacter halophilus TaxID=576117 RepID=A0A1I3N4L8_9RHOB|nr:hypothetical protein LX82_00282 [Celeribacter halophilus]SFJ04169.1 hypothetical protein SAMN04488138_101281 [Celeribacter halophilus]